jgi:NADPH-dependent 2,4-dienoyl-CoA reductase/sulfur reductase-like enzyme
MGQGVPFLPALMRTVLLVFVVAWFCDLSVAVDPVCIVGAGPAGLTVANRLQAKGYETVIFEKNPEVGGKCQAYYDQRRVFALLLYDGA